MDYIIIILLLFVFLKLVFTPIYEVKLPASKWTVNEVFFINHSIKTKGDIIMTKAKVDQTFKVKWPGPKDKYGNEATVKEGSVVFSSDDDSIASVAADPENAPYGAVVKTNEKTGATAIRIKATDGDGEGELEGQLAVEVVPGDAVAFGEPEATEPVDDEDEN